MKYVCARACVCGEPKTSKCGGGDVGWWVSGRGSGASAAASCVAYLKYEIHNGTSMSHTALACLGSLCMSKLSLCVCVCTFQLKVQLIYAVPLLIPSQNGCCQAEKLPNGPLKGLNGKLIHDCGLFGLLASSVKSWLVGESTSALSDAER